MEDGHQRSSKSTQVKKRNLLQTVYFKEISFKITEVSRYLIILQIHLTIIFMNFSIISGHLANLRSYNSKLHDIAIILASPMTICRLH
jgi:hypothetical protein